MAPKGPGYMESEFGPMSDEWPCLSFSQKSVGEQLCAEFRLERSVIIYVGTTDSETAENFAHRSRLISTVSIESNRILETSEILAPDVWADRAPDGGGVGR